MDTRPRKLRPTMFTTRTAAFSDLDDLCAMEHRIFPPEEAASRESFAARLAAFPEYFLILEKDGRTIGVAESIRTMHRPMTDDMLEGAAGHDPDGRWLALCGLAVIPEERRQGGASTLLRAMIEKARRERTAGVVLTCKAPLIAYYERFGFVNCGRSKSTHGGAVWFDMALVFESAAAAADRAVRRSG